MIPLARHALGRRGLRMQLVPGSCDLRSTRIVRRSKRSFALALSFAIALAFTLATSRVHRGRG